MDSYWSLSEYSSKVRYDGYEELWNFLESLNEEARQQEIHYTFERLVKGLASNRKSSRIGFGSTFLQFINHYKNFSTEEIMNVIDQCIIINKGGKVERRNAAIGKMLAYMSLLKSERILTTKILGSILENTFSMLPKAVAAVFPLLTSTIVSVLEKVSSKAELKQFFAVIEPHLPKSWETVNKFNLSLLLELNYKYKDIFGSFFSTYWKRTLLSNFKEGSKLYDLCLDDANWLPSSPQFSIFVLETALNCGVFDDCWESLVDNLLSLKSSNERKQLLCFEIIEYFITKFKNNPSKVKVILSDNCMSSILKNIGPGSFLSVRAKALLQHIASIFENNVDFGKSMIYHWIRTLQLNISFLTPVTRKVFSVGSQSADKVDSIKHYFDLLKKEFCKAVDQNEEHMLSLQKKKIFLLDEMCFVLTTYPSSAVSFELLLFLIQLSFFDYPKVIAYSDCEGTVHDPHSPSHMKRVRDHAEDCLYSLMKVIVTNAEIYRGFVKCIESLCVSEDLEKMRRMNSFPSSSQVLLKKYHNFLKVLKKDKKQCDPQIRQALKLLGSVMIIVSFTYPHEGESIYEDLIQIKANSCRDFHENVTVSGENLPWIDVTMEILISLCTVQSRSIRLVLKQIFEMLLPFLTLESLDSIFQLFASEGGGDSLLVSDSSDDDQQEEDLKDDGDVAFENPETLLSSCRRTKGTLDQFSKEAASNESLSQSGEENDITDDDAMFANDKALAEAFRLQSKRKSVQTKSLEFKVKALDFLSVLYSSSRIDLVVQTINSLTKIMIDTRTDKNYQSVFAKSKGILRKLENLQIPDENKYFPSTESCMKVAKELIYISGCHKSCTEAFVSTTSFLIKILLTISQRTNDGISLRKELIDLMTESIDQFFHPAGAKVHPLVFQTVIYKFPDLAPPLLSRLCEIALICSKKPHFITLISCTLIKAWTKEMLHSLENDEDNIDKLRKNLFKFIQHLQDKTAVNDAGRIRKFNIFFAVVSKLLINTQNVISRKHVIVLCKSLKTMCGDDCNNNNGFRNRCFSAIDLLKKRFSITEEEIGGNESLTQHHRQSPVEERMSGDIPDEKRAHRSTIKRQSSEESRGRKKKLTKLSKKINDEEINWFRTDLKNNDTNSCEIISQFRGLKSIIS